MNIFCIGDDIGVMHCGPHAIAEQLKKYCAKYSDFCRGTHFFLHKENF